MSRAKAAKDTVHGKTGGTSVLQNVKSTSTPDVRTYPRRQKSFTEHVAYVIRFTAIVIFMFTSLPVVWICTPLRFFHPLFRRFGVRNSRLPTDRIQVYWARTLLYIAEVKVTISGKEHLKNIQEPVVLMFSHASSIDPLIILAHCPITPKFIFKRELLFYMPYVGLLAWVLGHFPIDRKNRESAIKSLHEAGRSMKKYERSMAIFPEGTRSKTGKLQEFKKGGFHLTKAAGVPIIPAVFVGTFELWPPSQLLAGCGMSHMRFLPPIAPEDRLTVDELIDKTHKVFEDKMQELEKNPITPAPYVTQESCKGALVFLSVTLPVLAAIVRYYFF